MWWLLPCVLLLVLPSLWGGLGQQPRDSSGGKASAGAEGRVLLLGRSALFICFDGKEWPLWNVTHADLAGKTHKQSWAILVQINGNHRNFTFHTGAMQSFYCAAKSFFSHQQTQDYHRPPRKAIWSTVYSWVADYTDCILNSRMCTGSLCLWFFFYFF